MALVSNSINITSDDIKIAVLKKFRYDKYWDLAATEVKYCDVLAYNKRDSIICEVEVKVSFDDFLVDFEKEKHKRYAILEGLVPDYFFFAVPEKMSMRVLEYLNDSEYDHYGVMSYDNGEIIVYKKARRIRISDNTRKEFFDELMFRASSQIIGLYESNEAYKKKYGKLED